MIDKIKPALRVDGTTLDTEIQDLIDAAKADLEISGIKKIVDTDPLIVRAVILYCKADYATDNKEAERYKDSYDMLKSHLALSIDYTEEV